MRSPIFFIVTNDIKELWNFRILTIKKSSSERVLDPTFRYLKVNVLLEGVLQEEFGNLCSNSFPPRLVIFKLLAFPPLPSIFALRFLSFRLRLINSVLLPRFLGPNALIPPFQPYSIRPFVSLFSTPFFLLWFLPFFEVLLFFRLVGRKDTHKRYHSFPPCFRSSVSIYSHSCVMLFLFASTLFSLSLFFLPLLPYFYLRFLAFLNNGEYACKFYRHNYRPFSRFVLSLAT